MTDEEMDRRTERREQVIRRVNELMGWEYSSCLGWGAIRKVASAEAVAVSIDKLEQIIARLEGVPNDA